MGLVGRRTGRGSGTMDQGTNDTRRYLIGGHAYTLAEMLESNADDEDVCMTLSAMKPGDCLREMHAEDVDCVAVSS